MSNDEFDTWLSLVGRLLGLSERQRTQISEELRDHLENRVADLMQNGMQRQTAVMKAVEEFGDAAVLAKNLQSVSLANRKRWMMRFMTLATACLFLVAVLTMAMWPENARFGSPSNSVAQEDGEADPFGNQGDVASAETNPFDDSATATASKRALPRRPAVKPSERTMSNNRIREKLKTPSDMIYESEPFGDVVAQLSGDLGVNIVVDQNLEGILDSDTEVSANLAGVRTSDGLRMMLRPVDATYSIRDGVLLIISTDDEHEPDYLSRHMIDVREILQLISVADANRIGKPISSSVNVPVVGGGGFGGGGGGVFCLAPQAPATTKESDKSKNQVVVQQVPVPVLTAEKLLTSTITNVVSSDAWEANGGGNCQLTCIGGVLVLRANERVADEVQDFIIDLTYQMKSR
ncbi:permease prefix domain 1-containing protein [Mariniblastus fucicola]|uniref:Uncharacterized protein n=1 Tax=Mariniblastus fucicola TaxID=980251 RepID=A0A5B9PFJ4_9BACT|nr:permease prefix domain 1-containing protein [Mariniblastus fucicola]QEG25208.1 hypothetical protein MFFC18_51320 [Mariniblastus fucicola]